MMKRFGFLWCLFILPFQLIAQSDLDPFITKPRTFNIGISTGAAGLHWFLKPVAEIKVKNTSLRLTPGFIYVGGAIEQEFAWRKVANLHLYSNATKTNLVVSLQYQHQYKDFCPDLCNTSNYNELFALLGGIKTYRGRHFRYIKLGALAGQTTAYYEPYIGEDRKKPKVTNWIYPFGELGWGIYIFEE